MGDEAALWQAILAEPADERAWLVMADWLEENDDPPRAELFRTTLTLRLRSDEAHRPALEERQRELLAAGVRPAVPEVVNSIGMRFVLVPPGTFWMGSPERDVHRDNPECPRHEVEITRPFALGAFPVTQRQFESVLHHNPSRFCATGAGKDAVRGLDTASLPVDSVIYAEAVSFCEALSKLPEEKNAGRAYRLPTEAEWEYACRAGTSARWSFGDREADLKDHGWFRDNAGGTTHPVGQKLPSAWGLYDLYGNVAEFCHDWKDDRYYARSPRKDPPGPKQGHSRSLRGGAHSYGPEYCRTAYRDAIMPAGRNPVVGFRALCVLEAWSTRARRRR
jgi:uncharacterized protein (TIGR02996 family)